jgi:hypothetical protein
MFDEKKIVEARKKVKKILASPKKYSTKEYNWAKTMNFLLTIGVYSSIEEKKELYVKQ